MNNAEVLPSFIREKPGAPQTSADLSDIYVFWAPERLEDERIDYETGKQHCETALKFARRVQSIILPAYVFGGICSTRKLLPMEQGFIDALAVKATYGRLPDQVTPEDANELFRTSGQTIEEVRYGEQEARECLALARETQCPELVAGTLMLIVNGEMKRGALTFFLTVCGAAYLGALN